MLKISEKATINYKKKNQHKINKQQQHIHRHNQMSQVILLKQNKIHDKVMNQQVKNQYLD